MTTRIYKLRYAEGFEWLLPINDADFDQLRFDGSPRGTRWQPVKMRRLRTSERGRTLQPADFLACSGGELLILGRAARDKLSETLVAYGELLPLLCEDGEYWVLNVTRLVDALDEGKSQVLRASSTGPILMIRKHEFRDSEEIQQAAIFKLSDMPRGLIYTNAAFVTLVKDSGLVGLEFDEVWSAD
jgi:hypothetical protein